MLSKSMIDNMRNINTHKTNSKYNSDHYRESYEIAARKALKNTRIALVAIGLAFVVVMALFVSKCADTSGATQGCIEAKSEISKVKTGAK